MQWFRGEAEVQKARDIKLLTHLVDDVKERMEHGSIPECLTAQTLQNMDKNGLNELEVAYAVSSPFGAGIETVRFTIILY